jgi:hypothetical protein
MPRIAKNPYAPPSLTYKTHLLEMGYLYGVMLKAHNISEVGHWALGIGHWFMIAVNQPNLRLALDLWRVNYGIGAGSKGGDCRGNDKGLKILKEERHSSQTGRGQSVKEKQTVKGSAELQNRLVRHWNRAPGRDSLKKPEPYIIIKICLCNSKVKVGLGCNPEWKQGIKPVRRNNLNLLCAGSTRWQRWHSA